MTAPQPSLSGSDAVSAALAALGWQGRLRRFDDPVPTAEAAAGALGCPVGAIANSLVFDADGDPLLVLASGAHRVDTRGLAESLGVRRIRRASAPFVVEHTGQQIGGVAPVGHPAPLPTVVDRALADFDVVWAGGGDEHTMMSTNFEELLRMTQGTPRQVAADGP